MKHNASTQAVCMYQDIAHDRRFNGLHIYVCEECDGYSLPVSTSQST